MGSYQNINTVKPEGIENKKAYLVGSGIASLAAAFFLVRDGKMPGENINILERKNINGGALDGSGNAEEGYVIRGGREMEDHYECTWNMFGDIPTIKNPERTVLDEFVEINKWDATESVARVIYERGIKADTSTLGLSDSHVKQLAKLFLVKEDTLGAATVEQFFDPTFLETNMWLFWRTMFAFETWHSVVEMKRYMQRFIHLMPGMSKLQGILFSEYNQYDSFVKPLVKWLKDNKVNFMNNTLVTDLDMDITNSKKVVTDISIVKDGKEEVIKITKDDIVFVTNGSMTENSAIGDSDRAPELIRTPGAVWNLWDNIAKKDLSFGRPEVFHGDIDKTKWESFTVTFKKSKIAKVLEDLTGIDPYCGKGATGSVISIKDSNWLMSFAMSRQPHFESQPDDVLVLWAYGLFVDNEGDYIKKKMSDCTGHELLRELLYHLNVEGDLMEEIIDSAIVKPVMMPYVTSQFMPRVKGDRPEVIPAGCKNLAFLGQFAEVEDDCVFTVEYSVRSAMMGVYGLLDLEKEVPEIYGSKFDIRAMTAAGKVMNSGRPFPAEGIIKKLLKDTTMEGLI